MMNEEIYLTELPQGWTLSKIGEVADYINGKAFKPSEWEHQGKPIIRIQNLTQSTEITNRYSKPIEDRYIVKDGDLLISWSATLGAFIYRGEEAVLNQHIFNTHPYINKMFLFYLISAYIGDLKRKVHGTGMQHITKGKFEESMVPLPPTPEQQRIVAKIEELFTKLDAGVEALKKVKTQLKSYRQAVLKHAFEGKLTAEWREAHKGEMEPASVLVERIREEWKKNAKGKLKELPPVDTSDLPALPEGWLWTGVGSIVESMQNGIYKQRHFYSDDGVACLRMYNIEDGRNVRKDIKRMNLTTDEVERYRLRLGDILVNRVNSRELVGKAAPIPSGLETCVYESKNIRIRLWSGIESKYIAFWFQVFAQRFFNRHAQQTVGMASINQEQIASMPIPLTVTAEQQQIISEIERCFSIADQIEKAVEQGLMQGERLRQSILRRAFEGKLVPQDPNDEPAEKLLERIKAEKAKREAEKKVEGRGRKRLNTIQGRLM